jgi:hypothetical protein
MERDAVNAAGVIKEANAAGVRIAIKGSGLSLEAIAPPPKAIIDLITEHKLEIVALLSSAPDGPAEKQIGWLDMVASVENEAGRHRIWLDELTRRAAEDKLTAVERDTLERAIANHARDARIFEAVLRLIERVRAD